MIFQSSIVSKTIRTKRKILTTTNYKKSNDQNVNAIFCFGILFKPQILTSRMAVYVMGCGYEVTGLTVLIFTDRRRLTELCSQRTLLKMCSMGKKGRVSF